MHDVTIVCATRNGGDAVRLTFESLRRTTVAPLRVLVADNGSVDGTREMLGGLDWIELHRRRPGRHAPGHGATLDWLVRKVTTRLVLTLDSDVVFLRRGWLEELRAALDRSGAIAVGELEPAVGGYRARLSPALLLLDTERLRALRCSFRSYVRIDDPDEALRWRRRPASGEQRAPGRAGDVSQRRLLHDRRPSVRASARVGIAVVGDTGGDPSQVPPPRPHVVGGGADDELSERNRQNELHVRTALAARRPRHVTSLSNRGACSRRSRTRRPATTGRGYRTMRARATI